jgi:O-antigen ligase
MRSRTLSSRILLVAILVGIIGAIALTQSRGGGLALILVSIFLLLRRPSIKTMAVGVVLLAAALVVTPVTYLERMETVTEVGDADDKSLDHRLHFVVLGVEVFIRHPILGVGLGNFGTAISEIDPKFGPGQAAHNMYLEFFVENGLFAGLLFLTILASAFFTLMRFGKLDYVEPRSYDLGFCFAMSLIGVLFTALFLSVGSRPIIWIFVGIAGACSGVIARRNANEQSWSRDLS